MRLNGQEIVFASLAGSKAAGQIPRLGIVQNELMKHVGPVVPFLPFKRDEEFASTSPSVPKSEKWKTDLPKNNQFFPLSIRRTGESGSYYTLPWEPLISISGGAEIVKRSVAKISNASTSTEYIGTVKERFSAKDYAITITGVLLGKNMTGGYENTFPRKDFEALRDYCLHPKGLDVQCELLQLLGINRIVVESFNFPFSKGEEVQAYELQCLSDFTADFLLEIK